VLIAKLVDTNSDGVPSAGDTVVLGQYPNRFALSATYAPAEFDDWGVQTHTIDTVRYDFDYVEATSADGDYFWWYKTQESNNDSYVEGISAASVSSQLQDFTGSLADSISTRTGSPSRPARDLTMTTAGPDDGRFIDVEVDY
jgi:hypothetical protein